MLNFINPWKITEILGSKVLAETRCIYRLYFSNTKTINVISLFPF
jgi:hypothetical protein